MHQTALRSHRLIAAFITLALLSIIALAAETAAATTTRTIVSEDFESFHTTKALRAVWTSGPGHLVTNAPGGSQAAAHDGTGMNRRAGFFVYPDSTHNIILSADFYDFATNTEQNVTVSLNDDDGHSNVAIGLKGAYSYVIRVGGFGVQTNWVPFKRDQVPVEGWHRFKAVISTTNVLATLDLQADGQIDQTLNLPLRSSPPTFTQLRFGGYAAKLAAGGTVLIDNIRLELVSLAPEAIAPTPAVIPQTTNVAFAAATTSKPTNFTPAIVAEQPPTKPTAVSAPISTPLTASSQTSLAANHATPPTIGAPTTVANPETKLNGTFPAAVYWIGAALAVIIALLVSLMLTVRRHTAMLPKALLNQGPETNTGTITAVATTTVDDDWRKRALHAEALAAKQAQVLGEKVGPELVEFAKQTLVQGLYNQRNELIETQTKAKQVLNELESRLSELHLPAQERIKAYEKRIGELEQELQSRNVEMRELTQATLMLVKQKLDEEKVQQQNRRFN